MHLLTMNEFLNIQFKKIFGVSKLVNEALNGF